MFVIIYYTILIMMNWLHANGGLKSRYKLRLVIALTAALGFLLYRFLYYAATPNCLRDAWHDLTLPLNKDLADGSGGDNVVIGIGQVLMDGWIFIIVILWYCESNLGWSNLRMGEWPWQPSCSSFFERHCS